MRKQLFLVSMTLLSVLSLNAQTFAGGEGTAEKPYEIATAEQMKEIINAAVPDQTTYFKMTADVDMSSVTDWVPFNAADPYNKRVIFDGNTHKIKNFTSGDTNYSSFAGVLYGEVKNVEFVNATVTNQNGSHCGIVAGYLGTGGKSGAINNVIVNGQVTNNNKAVHCGGVVGNFRLGSIKNVYADVKVVSATNEDRGVGGIAGYQYDGMNIKEYVADVNTIIENCYFTGSVDAPACRVGGIVGKSENRYGSVVKGNIVVASSINGIADITGLVIGNCPDAYYEKGLVTNNYASSYTKLLYAGAEVTPAPNENGQETGSHHGTITDNVINAAKTIGWDSKVWNLTGPEPELILTASDDVKPRTEGTESNPYLISSADDLKAMISQVVEDETVYFKMTADVDMSGVEDWVPFNQVSPFRNRVVFDGDGHTIKNLTCKNQIYSSFAGVLYGEIKNVAFVDATIENTTGSHCGVVAGYLGTGGIYGEINNVYVNGKVTNDNAGVHAGGVTGNFKYGSIKNCYVDVNVTSATKEDRGVGGIAGYQYDGNNLKESTPDVNTIIENCYFVGSVNAPDAHVGGILGKSENRYGNWVKGNITNAVSLNGAANCGGSTQTVGLIMGRCYADYYAKGCVLNNYSGQNTKAFANGTAIERTEGQQGDSYNGTIATSNLCATAKTIGWDENVWNLDGSVPMLKAFPYTSTDLTLEATDGDAYYATFSAAEPVFFPNDVEVLAVTVDGNTLNMDKAFGGNYVPANTGVLLKTAGTAVTYYTDKKTIAPSTAENALIAGTGTTPDDASKKYYKLAYSDSSKTPSTLGFYWGVENGVPFKTTVGKAYLVVGASAAKAGFRFFEDETTGITTMTPQPTTHNQMYNLAGQRVNVNAKGIVIKNGKKFINK